MSHTEYILYMYIVTSDIVEIETAVRLETAVTLSIVVVVVIVILLQSCPIN